MQGAKLQAEAMRQFQMRALSLLDIWLKKQSHSALIPLLAVPLLRALRVAARPGSDATLSQRLSQVLVHQLAGSKPALPATLQLAAGTGSAAVAPGSDGRAGTEQPTQPGLLSDMPQILAKTMYFATREAGPEVHSAATSVYTCLLAAVGRAAGRSAGEAPAPPAQQLLETQCTACVHDVLHKRKSRWTHATLANMMAACKAAAPCFLHAAASGITAARSEFTRVEALQICAASMKCAACDSVAASRVLLNRIKTSSVHLQHCSQQYRTVSPCAC